MEAILVILVIAVLIEAVVQVIKESVPKEAVIPEWMWPLVSAGLGVIVCVLASVDVFASLGVALSIPMVGSILTGVLVSRGASFVHDIWDRINGINGINVPVEIPVDVHIDGFQAIEKPPDME